MPADPQSQHRDFLRAVTLLGGQRATARAIGVSERSMRGLCSGERTLHGGYLRDVAAALLAHAEACRAAERALSPAFAANLTEHQAHERPHNWRYDRRAAPATTPTATTGEA